MRMARGKQSESGPFARAISAEIRAEIARNRSDATRLAEAAGMSRSYLSKRLRDEAPLTANDIEALCATLGLDILAFLAAAARANGGIR